MIVMIIACVRCALLHVCCGCCHCRVSISNNNTIRNRFFSFCFSHSKNFFFIVNCINFDIVSTGSQFQNDFVYSHKHSSHIHTHVAYVHCSLLTVPVNNNDNNQMEQVNVTSFGDIYYAHFLTLNRESRSVLASGSLNFFSSFLSLPFYEMPGVVETLHYIINPASIFVRIKNKWNFA